MKESKMRLLSGKQTQDSDALKNKKKGIFVFLHS
jgi:hypothetical protein